MFTPSCGNSEIKSYVVKDIRTGEEFISYVAARSFMVDGIVYHPPIIFDTHPGPMLQVKYDGE